MYSNDYIKRKEECIGQRMTNNRHLPKFESQTLEARTSTHVTVTISGQRDIADGVVVDRLEVGVSTVLRGVCNGDRRMKSG
jgi:hypothetical protein